LKRELGIFNPDDILVRKVELINYYLQYKINILKFVVKYYIITKCLFQPQINGVGKKRKPINADQIHSSPEQDSQRQGEWTRL